MASKQKILIVDDDENIAELISLYLLKECYDTRIVHDGESALQAVPEFNPNLILLDLMLPGIDGYQVCRELRKESSIPIIMLSAKGEVFDKVLGLELGADDYIIKPFDSKELVARVKAVLRRAVPACSRPGGASQAAGTVCGIPGSHCKPDQLLGDLHGTFGGNAAEGAGASLFPCFLPQSGIHKRTASGSYLGL